MLHMGWRIWDAGYGIEALGCRIWDGGYGMVDMGCRIWDAGYGMEAMGCRLWDAGTSDPTPGRHFPMQLPWSSLARINWCLHGAFPVCKAADGSRSGAICFGALQSSAAVQEGCAVCIRSLQLCMLLRGPFATRGLQAGGVQHVVGVAGGNKGARSWGCKKETVQQGAGGCKTQASCSMQLGLQGANRAASSCGLQEATRVQEAGIARSKQCSKQLGLQKATVVLHAAGVARSK